VILADTSIWIDHLRAPNALFGRLLVEEQILVHPYVIGALAVGNLKERNKLLREMTDQPPAKKALDCLGRVLVLLMRTFWHLPEYARQNFGLQINASTQLPSISV
jgi:hypothetical protein